MGEGKLPDNTEYLQETLPSVSTVVEAVGAKQRILPFLSDQNQTFPFNTAHPHFPLGFSNCPNQRFVPRDRMKGRDLEPSPGGAS